MYTAHKTKRVASLSDLRNEKTRHLSFLVHQAFEGYGDRAREVRLEITSARRVVVNRALDEMGLHRYLFYPFVQLWPPASSYNVHKY